MHIFFGVRLGSPKSKKMKFRFHCLMGSIVMLQKEKWKKHYYFRFAIQISVIFSNDGWKTTSYFLPWSNGIHRVMENQDSMEASKRTVGEMMKSPLMDPWVETCMDLLNSQMQNQVSNPNLINNRNQLKLGFKSFFPLFPG